MTCETRACATRNSATDAEWSLPSVPFVWLDSCSIWVSSRTGGAALGMRVGRRRPVRTPPTALGIRRHPLFAIVGSQLSRRTS